MKKIFPSHLILLAGVAVVLAWSAGQPYDRLTWWLEVLPALAALAVLFATYRRFEFTTLTYTLIALHMCVLFVGGHYTYARVPLFDWLRPIFGWHRNHYDRLGHILQGFVPAIVTREVFVRLHILKEQVGSLFWLFAFALPLALCTSSLNGGPRCLAVMPPLAFSAPRATPGILRKTCFAPCSALLPPSFYCRGFRIARLIA